MPVELYNASDSELTGVAVQMSIKGADGSEMALKPSFEKTFAIGKNLPVDTLRMSLADFKTENTILPLK